jgi:uncharacterized membrane protein
LVTSFLCLIFWIVVAITQPLPEPLASYVNAQKSTDSTLFSILALIALAGMLVSYVGLFLVKKWGRALFITTTLIMTFLTLFEHPMVITANTNVLSSIGDMLNGAIIAVSLFTPLFNSSDKT